MTPKVGEVFMLDLGYEGKVRPVVILSREDANAPRALALLGMPKLREQLSAARGESLAPLPDEALADAYSKMSADERAEDRELGKASIKAQQRGRK